MYIRVQCTVYSVSGTLQGRSLGDFLFLLFEAPMAYFEYDKIQNFKTQICQFMQFQDC